MRSWGCLSEGRHLDTGALIGLDRGDTRVTALLQRIASEPDAVVSIPAGVVGQAWCGGQRQTRLASLLSAPETSMVPLGRVTLIWPHRDGLIWPHLRHARVLL